MVGRHLLTKLFLWQNLTLVFLYEKISKTVELIVNAGSQVQAIICDGNRTNQAFFKQFETVSGKNLLTTDGKFLLFDCVHLLKNIRNLWLTEITQQL